MKKMMSILKGSLTIAVLLTAGLQANADCSIVSLGQYHQKYILVNGDDGPQLPTFKDVLKATMTNHALNNSLINNHVHISVRKEPRACDAATDISDDSCFQAVFVNTIPGVDDHNCPAPYKGLACRDHQFKTKLGMPSRGIGNEAIISAGPQGTATLQAVIKAMPSICGTTSTTTSTTTTDDGNDDGAASADGSGSYNQLPDGDDGNDTTDDGTDDATTTAPVVTRRAPLVRAHH